MVEVTKKTNLQVDNLCVIRKAKGTLSISDGSSLRLVPGSALARHLEGLLELGFCGLDPSIGMGQALD